MERPSCLLSIFQNGDDVFSFSIRKDFCPKWNDHHVCKKIPQSNHAPLCDFFASTWRQFFSSHGHYNHPITLCSRNGNNRLNEELQTRRMEEKEKIKRREPRRDIMFSLSVHFYLLPSSSPSFVFSLSKRAYSSALPYMSQCHRFVPVSLLYILRFVLPSHKTNRGTQDR